MRVTQIIVKRKFNLGNYESLDLQLGAELISGDDPAEAIRTLEKLIEDHYRSRHGDVEHGEHENG